MKNFNDWVLEMIETPLSERKEIANEIIESTSKMGRSKELQDFLESVISHDWIDIGFSANIEFIPLNEKGKIQLTYWNRPLMCMKHRKLPAIAIFGTGIEDSVTHLREFQKSYDGPVEKLTWCRTLSFADKKRKEQWINQILNAMRTYRRKKEPTKELVYLSDALQNTKDWEIIGFSCNLQYVRVAHKNPELTKYLFVHPWGTPPVLVIHKRLPLFLIAGAGIRWNDSILKEIKNNTVSVSDIEGATG